MVAASIGGDPSTVELEVARAVASNLGFDEINLHFVAVISCADFSWAWDSIA